MAKGIPTLIKLKKRELDELRKEIGALMRQKDLLVELSRSLDTQLAAENEFAGSNGELTGYLGGFTMRVRKRQEGIAREILKLDEQAEMLREKVAEVFGEQKRFEIVQKSAEKRVHDAQARKDQIALDEIGVSGYRRQHANAE